METIPMTEKAVARPSHEPLIPHAVEQLRNAAGRLEALRERLQAKCIPIVCLDGPGAILDMKAPDGGSDLGRELKDLSNILHREMSTIDHIIASIDL